MPSKRTKDGYYVYLHIDQNGRIRYVGKGSGPRAYDFSIRGARWNKVFSEKNPPSVLILKDKMTNEEAIKFEKKTIVRLQLLEENLCNKPVQAFSKIELAKMKSAISEDAVVMVGMKAVSPKQVIDELFSQDMKKGA